MTQEIASTAAGQVRGTLNGQLALPFAGEKLGLGTYGKNGCGIIAVYNALQLLGRPQPLGEITLTLSAITGFCSVDWVAPCPGVSPSFSGNRESPARAAFPAAA